MLGLLYLTYFQLTKLFIMEYDLELVLTNLSYAIPSVIYLLKYNTFYIQSRKVGRYARLIEVSY